MLYYYIASYVSGVTMPATPLDRLPEQMVIFVTEFANTGRGKESALVAGVHPDRAGAWARIALGDPNVRAACEWIVRNRFAESGPLALNVLLELTGPKYEPRIRLEAAKGLLDRSGYTAKDMRDAKTADKDLREMDREELLATVQQAEDELASRAKLIEIAPTFDANAAQAIDLEA